MSRTVQQDHVGIWPVNGSLKNLACCKNMRKNSLSISAAVGIYNLVYTVYTVCAWMMYVFSTWAYVLWSSSAWAYNLWGKLTTLCIKYDLFQQYKGDICMQIQEKRPFSFYTVCTSVSVGIFIERWHSELEVKNDPTDNSAVDGTCNPCQFS